MPAQQSDKPVPALLENSPPSALPEWILLHAGFVTIGLITPLIGPLLPYFIRHWSLSDSQAGLFFTAQFFGSFLGTASTSYLLPKFGSAKVLALGFLFFVIGFSFFGVGPWLVSVLAVAVYGAGYGLCNPTTNLRATQLPSSNMAGAVSLLNFSWGIGAVLCPFVAGILLPRVGLRGIAALLITFSVIIAGFHLSRVRAASAIKIEHRNRSLQDWLQNLRPAPSVSLVLLFFLYVGCEVGIGGWVAGQEKRVAPSVASTIFLAPSFFYGFLLIGRGLVPLALRRLSTASLSIGGLLLAATGTSLILISHHVPILCLGASFAGLGLAPQYPVVVTWLAQIYRENADWLSALFFAAAGLGGAILPWLIGVVSAKTNSLAAGFVVPLAAILIMVWLALRSRPSTS